MKEIRMDFDRYEDEKMASYYSGIDDGVLQVSEWISSGKTLLEYLDLDPTDSVPIAWKKVAKVLGRENELKPPQEDTP